METRSRKIKDNEFAKSISWFFSLMLRYHTLACFTWINVSPMVLPRKKENYI